MRRIKTNNARKPAKTRYQTPIGLAVVPILVFLLDAFPPPGFSIADFNARMVCTISAARGQYHHLSLAATTQCDVPASFGLSASNSYRLLRSAPLCTISLNVALFLLDCEHVTTLFR